MTDTAIATRPILVPGRTCWTLSPQTAGGLLIDGRDYFRTLYRAASQARRYILLCGWQFDRNVSLLRGKDRAEAWTDPRLLPFLKVLLDRNPQLEVRILCWDYSPAYFFQREWFQDYRFNWSTGSRLKFRFDDRHAFGASHHQKFVVIDGALGFVGSMDLCNERWDHRKHPAHSVERLEPFGEDHYGPYHEVQTVMTGPVVSELADLFRARWRSSGGGDLELPEAAEEWTGPIGWSVRIPAREVGLSRTVAQTIMPEQPSIREIRQLYIDAIDSAERSVFIENQYCGSTAVTEALLSRICDRDRAPLNIVMIYPEKLHSFTESLSMGSAQKRMFHQLVRAALTYGHRLGVYFCTSADEEGRQACRYIHSKVMIVDDRFLTVGSANTNNRSMGLDTELNVSWEAHADDVELKRAIRRARVSLLAEHACLLRRNEVHTLYDDSRMVETIDGWIGRKAGGLRRHALAPSKEETAFPVALDLDPERPAIEEDLFERVAPSRSEMLKAGFHRIRRRVRHVGRRRRVSIAVDPPSSFSSRPALLWHAASRWSRRLLIPVIALGVAAGFVWLLVLLIRAILSLFHVSAFAWTATSG